MEMISGVMIDGDEDEWEEGTDPEMLAKLKNAKLVYGCCLCGKSIEATEVDPCALGVTAAWAGPEQEQRYQQFWCHGACLEEHLATEIRGELTVIHVEPELPADVVAAIQADQA